MGYKHSIIKMKGERQKSFILIHFVNRYLMHLWSIYFQMPKMK